MDHVITRCPKCSTAFRVTPAQLSVANGSVRCGFCLTVFKVVNQVNKPVDKKQGQKINSQSASKPAVTIPPSGTPSGPPSGAAVASAGNIESTAASIKNHPKIPSNKTLEGLPKQTDRKIESSFINTNSGVVERSKVKSTETEPVPKVGADVASLQQVAHGKKSLLSTIQPAPVEMAWNENESKNSAWPWIFSILLLLLLMALQIGTFKFQILSKVDPYRSVYKIICPIVNCAYPI